MSRSGYSDDYDILEIGRWRGQVASSIRGKRGQMFLRAIRTALLAMPVRALYPGVLVGNDGCCCTMGAFANHCGIDVSDVDPEDPDSVAAALGVTEQLVREIAYLNDECGSVVETPEKRWERMLKWIEGRIND